MKAVRLLLADVDGTLVTREKILTARTKDAVNKMRAAGVEFAITSGRPPRGMQMLIQPLALTTPIAAFNGGRFVRPVPSVVEDRRLPTAAPAPPRQIKKTHRLGIWVFLST